MSYARVYLTHKKLNDAKISMYVNFADAPDTRDMLEIGIGTGNKQEITLEDNNIDFSEFNLYDGTTPIMNFDYDTETNTISFVATKNNQIYASYKYNCAAEDWQPMELVDSSRYLGNPQRINSYYVYLLANNGKPVSSFRVICERPSNTATNEVLGVATGLHQTFFLDHNNASDIKIFQNDVAVSRKNWSYDADTNTISVLGIKGRNLTATYDWIAEVPEIYGYVAAWNG